MAASLAPVRASVTLFIFLLVLLTEAIPLPSSYDTIWITQSTQSSGSMPVGGGSIGLNAWAESGKPDLLFKIFVSRHLQYLRRQHSVLHSQWRCI
jgi:hypothetical protein